MEQIDETKVTSLVPYYYAQTCLIAGCVDEQIKSEDNTSTIPATVNEAEFAQIMAEANTAYIKADSKLNLILTK
ncbi:hypothetical protein [Methanolobus sp.]|uniref:hypothetical protein n=1 Tax=Methanolobus sp. TaxID=1874737 RepID=UPI0025FB8E63|nr:hypothetical protein [Methanolobus sp.]